MIEPFDTGVRPDEVASGKPRFLRTPFGPMALHRVESGILAAQAFCPHMEGPLWEGTLSGEHIVCPWHQWRYDLRSGKRILLGLIARGGATGLLVCDVSTSESGTLVLSNPRRG